MQEDCGVPYRETSFVQEWIIYSVVDFEFSGNEFYIYYIVLKHKHKNKVMHLLVDEYMTRGFQEPNLVFDNSVFAELCRP